MEGTVALCCIEYKGYLNLYRTAPAVVGYFELNQDLRMSSSGYNFFTYNKRITRDYIEINIELQLFLFVKLKQQCSRNLGLVHITDLCLWNATEKIHNRLCVHIISRLHTYKYSYGITYTRHI